MPSGAGVVAGIAVVAAGLLLIAVSEALPAFVIGLVLAFVLDPLVTWFAARRVPRGLATLLAMVLLAVIVGTFAVLFLETIATQAAVFIASLPAAFAQLETWILSLGLPAGIEEDLVNFISLIEQSAASIDITVLFEPILEGLFAILGSFFTILTLPFFMSFVLAGRAVIGREVREVLPGPWRDDVLTVLGITLSGFSTYIRAEAVAGILGLMTFVGIMLLSVTVHPDYAFRRASGLDRDEALAWGGDTGRETVLGQPVPPRADAVTYVATGPGGASVAESAGPSGEAGASA